MIDQLRFLTTINFPNDSSSSSGVGESPNITKSADFDNGTSDNLFSGSHAALNLDATDFTIVGWFKQKADNITRSLVTYGDSDAPATFNYQIATVATNAVRAFISNGIIQFQVDSNTIALGTDDWHFFCVTFNNTSKNFTCSLDDGTAGSTTATVIVPQIDDTFFLGKATGSVIGSSDYFMCGVGIWTRVLTSGEITSLYNLGTGAKKYSSLTAGEKTGIVSYWHLDESSDGTTQVDRADSSGNGLTLTDPSSKTPSANDAP